jgi:signal transduction histidine kinase
MHLLHLEDSELDHELALAHLRRAGLEVSTRRVESRAEFAAALLEPWDLVLSDFHLPGFSGLEALEMVRAQAPHLPFILVSGQIGEETAVHAMHHGASDYLLKQNLARLPPAVEHAIARSREQADKRQADLELAQSRLRLSQLAQHLQTSVEAERHAIAREIHDDVGGSLTALQFELDWIKRHLRPSAEPALSLPAVALSAGDLAALQQRAASAQEMLTHAIGASQRIMQNLRPAILEQGLVAALQWMTRSFEKRTGIVCSFRTSHERLQLPAGVPLVAYRTAQEALTNVLKHAQASHVVVDLSLAGDVLSLEVQDDGQGLAAPDLAKAQSFGIRGLHERASTVGGWVELSGTDAGPSRGTTLILSVPVDASATSCALEGIAKGQERVDPGAEPLGGVHNRSDDGAWTTHY